MLRTFLNPDVMSGLVMPASCRNFDKFGSRHMAFVDDGLPGPKADLFVRPTIKNIPLLTAQGSQIVPVSQTSIRSDRDMGVSLDLAREKLSDLLIENPETRFHIISVEPAEGQEHVSPTYWKSGAAEMLAEKLGLSTKGLTGLDFDAITALMQTPEKLTPLERAVLSLALEMTSIGDSETPVFVMPNSMEDIPSFKPAWIHYNTGLALIRFAINSTVIAGSLVFINENPALPALIPSVLGGSMSGYLQYQNQLVNEVMGTHSWLHLPRFIPESIRSRINPLLAEPESLAEQLVMALVFLLAIRVSMFATGLTESPLAIEFLVHGLILGSLRSLIKQGVMVRALQKYVASREALAPHTAKAWAKLNDTATVGISAFMTGADVLEQVEWDYSGALLAATVTVGLVLYGAAHMMERSFQTE